MKLALIPPVCMLGKFEDTDIHLVLAQQFETKAMSVEKRTAYAEYYRTRSQNGDYVILDNGAREGTAIHFDILLDIAITIKADEVCVPDVPFESAPTLLNAQTVMSYLQSEEGYAKYAEANFPRLMFIPQVEKGSDLINAYAMATGALLTLLAVHEWPVENTTIGVPLPYDILPGDLYKIVDRVTWLVEEQSIPIHLLGWSRRLSTPLAIARDYPSIRSTDTAKPFTLAVQNTWHQDLWNVTQIGGIRPENYFVRQFNKLEEKVANRNIKTFREHLEHASSVQELPESANALLKTYREETARIGIGLSDQVGGFEGNTTSW